MTTQCGIPGEFINCDLLFIFRNRLDTGFAGIRHDFFRHQIGRNPKVKIIVMCYHYSLAASPDELAARYRREKREIERYIESYHISAFTHSACPVVTNDLEIRMFRWGLIPFWTQSPEDAAAIRNRTINARSETVFTKPSFREAVRHKRCLVPATGFFDWRHEGSRKIPYFISLKEEGIFSFAGLYDAWQDPATNELLYTFSILTTDANPMMRYIHNTNFRMPVILHPEEESLWLDPLADETALEKLFVPYDESAMQAYTVAPGFLKMDPHDPKILVRRE